MHKYGIIAVDVHDDDVYADDCVAVLFAAVAVGEVDAVSVYPMMNSISIFVLFVFVC